MVIVTTSITIPIPIRTTLTRRGALGVLSFFGETKNLVIGGEKTPHPTKTSKPTLHHSPAGTVLYRSLKRLVIRELERKIEVIQSKKKIIYPRTASFSASW